VAGPQRILGGHLVHLVVLAGWLLAVAVVLAWPTRATAASSPTPADPSPGARSDRLRPPLLQLAAIGLLASGAIHLSVLPDHWRQAWFIGLFFLVAAGCQVAAAGLLLTHPTRRLVLAVVVGSLAVVAMWGWSRLVGVPFTGNPPEPVGVLDVLATTAELATVVAGVLWLRHRQGGAAPVWRWAMWSGAMRSTLLATTTFLTVAILAAPKG
jgi:hypothetical protein